VVRLRDVASVEDSYEQVKTAANFMGKVRLRWRFSVSRCEHREGVDSIKAALPGFKAQLPESVKMTLVNDRSVSIREAA
jgi:HAE1 family hydrophobic/amphiphilic exporter-1